MDLSTIPLDQLLQMRQQLQPPPAQEAAPAPAPAPATPDLGSMPIEQLIQLRDQLRGQQAPQQPDPNAQPAFVFRNPMPRPDVERNAMVRATPQAADDAVRQAANGATFGFADRIAGGLNGTGAEAERARTAEAAQRLGPVASTAADIAGGVASGYGLARVGLTASRLIPQAWNAGLTGVGLRTAAAGADGAAMGALSGFGHGTDPLRGAAVGGAVGAGGNLAIAEPIRAIARGVGGLFNRPAEPPTTAELRAQGQAAYRAADDAGVIINPQAIQRLRENIVQDLTQQGYTPRLQPRVAAVLDELDHVGGQNMTLQGGEILRRVAGNLRGSADESERRLGNRIISQIDNWMGNLQPSDVVMGNAQAGTQALGQARDFWARARRSEAIDDAVTRAERRAASTGSGGNEDSAIRQNIRGILDSPRRSQGFSPDERAAMETVVRGTPDQNILRLVGKLSPSGNGLMAALGLGAAGAGGAVGGPVGAVVGGIPSAVGMAAKALADGGTRRNVEILSRLVRGGGDAAALTPPPNLLQRSAEPARELLTRLLMTGAALSPAVVRPVQ